MNDERFCLILLHDINAMLLKVLKFTFFLNFSKSF